MAHKVKHPKLTLAILIVSICLLLSGCEMTQTSFDNPFDVTYSVKPQRVVYSKAFNRFQHYRHYLKKRKYITIDQFEHLLVLYNKVVIRDDKRLNLFYSPHVKMQASYELHVTRTIMNSHQNWNVVDDDNGMEYYVTIYFDGMNHVTDYSLRHVLSDDQFAVNEDWDKKYNKMPIY